MKWATNFGNVPSSGVSPESAWIALDPRRSEARTLIADLRYVVAHARAGLISRKDTKCENVAAFAAGAGDESGFDACVWSVLEYVSKN